jgi:hypothetical protein
MLSCIHNRKRIVANKKCHAHKFSFSITGKTPFTSIKGLLLVIAEKELQEADEEWGSKIFEVFIEDLKKGCHVQKDTKSLKFIEQQDGRLAKMMAQKIW